MANDNKITITVSGKHGTGKVAIAHLVSNAVRNFGIPTQYEPPHEDGEYDLTGVLESLVRTARVEVREQQIARDAVESAEEMCVLSKAALDGMKAEVDAWRRAAGLIGYDVLALEQIDKVKQELTVLRKWKREHKGAYAALMAESRSRPATPRTGELTERDKCRLLGLREFASKNKCKQEVVWQDSLELARQHDAYEAPETVPYKLDLPRYLNLLEMHFGAELDKVARCTIVDEAHHLSKNAWDSLRKDGEEPLYSNTWKRLASTSVWDIRISDKDELLIRNRSFAGWSCVSAIPQAANAMFVVPCAGVTMGSHE